jgi:ABC-2 type transport system ATP-binding protein
VVDRLNLEAPEGSIYALVGPNGAGKTTTLKMLMNIVRPSGGRSEVLATDSRRLGPAQFAEIGYVSENQEMPEWMTVEYYLNFLRWYYPTWDDALAFELLREFELPRNRKLKHLSRGMRMKVALASSLAYRPKLIVLDEPFTGLDALVRDQVISGLLGRADGATILISSHDLAEVESFASHIGYLDAGGLRFSEQLEALSGRFREILLTFDAAPAMPPRLPSRWVHAEASGGVLRLIDTQYKGECSAEELRQVFPDFREMTVSAMPLRTIFVTLAKTGQAAR